MAHPLARWHPKLKYWHALARWHDKLKNWHAFATLTRWHVYWHVKMRSWQAFGTLTRGHVHNTGTYGTHGTRFSKLSGNLVVKSEVTPRSGSVALRQLNPIHKKRP